MHSSWCRRATAVLTLAMLAAACADGPNADELLGDRAVATTSVQPGSDPLTPSSTTSPTPVEFPEVGPPDPDPTLLPTDDDYRIGVLDNGLTYLLRRNDTPGESLDLRLVVNAGSVHQPVGNDGSAHFLEHMLFNGTEAFPENQLTTELEGLGIRFGADVNAATTYDETYYVLGATTFQPGAVETAFDVLAEWAARATIDPAQVEAEIGVVRDELRQGRESVEGIIFDRFEELYTRGTPYEGHQVLGDAELLEETGPATLRAFYDDWYRPDNMAVVAVGDLSLDELELLVRERFEPLVARSTSSPAPVDSEIALEPAPVSEIVVHPDIGVDYLSIDIRLPVWDSATAGGERLTIIESAVGQMLRSRLAEAFQRGDLDLDDPPFVSTFALNRGLRYYGTNLRAPDLGVGLEQYMSQLLLAATEGFTDSDVQRVQTTMLAALDDEQATLGSVQDYDFADRLMAHFLEGEAIDDDSNRIDRQRAVIDSLTATELTEFWRWISGASGPIVILVTDDPASVPSASRLLTILESVQPAAPSETASAIERLVEPPTPAATIDENLRPTHNGEVSEWTFDNGVVVSHQETMITEGSFSVIMESTGGWSALPEADASLASAAVQAVLSSGVGPHDRATLARFLESRDVSLRAEINEQSEGLVGTSATGDAEAFFALSHLVMTEPRVDPLALRTTSRGAQSTLETAATNIELRAQIALTELVAGGDPRYVPILDQDEIDALDESILLDIFEHRFVGADDLHVAIVGDIDRATAFELSSRYLGTLPMSSADSWVALGAPAPIGEVSSDITLTDGTANGGLARLDWAEGEFNGEDELAATVLSTLITNRITETIREELGASYGGAGTVFLDREGDGALVSFLEVDGDPARLDEIRAAVDRIVTSFSTEGPGAEEFERALQVIETDLNFVNDELFLTANIATTRFPAQAVLQPDDRVATLELVTTTDIRDLAALLYADPVSVTVNKVLP